MVAPGSNVSLRCASRMANMSYALYRAGQETPLQYLQAQQPSWADFPLSGARAAGTYTCYYHTPTAPYVLSQSSEPLVITLEGKGTPTLARCFSFRPRGPGPQLLLPQTQVSGVQSLDPSVQKGGDKGVPVVQYGECPVGVIGV